MNNITEDNSLKLLGVRIPKKILDEFKILAIREGTTNQDLVSSLIKKYVEEHGDGNPAFALDHWIGDPEFVVCPAFFRPLEDWTKYLEGCTLQERQKFKEQLIGLDRRFCKLD